MVTVVNLDSDEILDQIYNAIHDYLSSHAKENLDLDLIDINLEFTKAKELHIELNLTLEVAAYSEINVDKLARDALEYGIKVADKICPKFIKIKGQLQKPS
jgi:isocitrate dehydrogenase